MAAMTAEQKQRAVAFLTANCDCWKGRGSVLNDMTPEQVLAAATTYNKAKAFDIVAERLGIDENLSLNATMDMMSGGNGGGGGSTQAGSEDECDPDDEDCDADDDAAGEGHPGYGTQNRRTDVRVPQLTENEWLAMAPPAVRERDAHAKRVLNREKAKLVGRLLVNVSDPARREARGKALMTRSLDELTEMLELIPEPVSSRRARDDSDEEAAAIYLSGGFNGRVDNADSEADAEDVRDMTPPTANVRDEVIDRKLGRVS